MKLTKEVLDGLLAKHITELTEQEINAVADIAGLKITNFKKNEWNVAFSMAQGKTTAKVQCSNKSCASISKPKATLGTSWGGVFSFRDIIRTFKTFFCATYEVTLTKPKDKLYTGEEREELAWQLLGKLETQPA